MKPRKQRKNWRQLNESPGRRWRAATAAAALLAGLVLPVVPLLAQAAPPPAAGSTTAAATPPAAPPPPAPPSTTPPPPLTGTGRGGPLSALRSPEFRGRTVEGVDIRGNREVARAVIQNLIRTRVGDPFDPQTVAEDYQRVYGLRKFANVEARVEPTATGVIVVFVVTEQRQIISIRFNGNRSVEDAELRSIVDVRPGEAIDSFRVALARQAIENLYHGKNFPLTQVDVDQPALTERGEVTFNITEGPNTRVRKVDFKSAGELSFSKDRLRDQVKTSVWVLVFSAGKYDPQQVEADVAALRKFYESKGFFDARVGRKVIWSPDLSEIQVDFLIEEGPRYVVDRVVFQGNSGLSDPRLRSVLKLTEGRAYDSDLQQRDIREMVREYGKGFGYIYLPQSTDPDYLRIEARPKFLAQPGHVELVYNIHEGKEFRIGNILVKGNYKSQDKLVLREFRDFTPGARFNAGELQDTEARLRRSPFFSSVTITPIGDDPGVRDVLVEITEQRTASFNIGAGVNSNGGIGGNVTYEQRNFDIANPPPSISEIFSDRAFTGAGQTLRISLEPGTEQSNAVIRFAEPYLFDQPFSLANEAYYRTRIREHYDDRRIGDQLTFGHRFDYIHSAAVSFRAEQVKIDDIEDPPVRAPEINAAKGDSFLTSIALTVVRDTTNAGIFPERGQRITGRWESYGAMGGDYNFQKFTVGFDAYQVVDEDLLDRKTVLGFHVQAGFIPLGDSVFFERFYGGGIGSVRGFEFRGIGPRSGIAEDPVGGDFSLTGSVELNFPVIGESLRGVVFVDAGDIESDVKFGTIRTSIGTGVRLILPFLGQTPLAIDFAVPITKAEQDEEQLISFSFGFTQ